MLADKFGISPPQIRAHRPFLRFGDTVFAAFFLDEAFLPPLDEAFSTAFLLAAAFLTRVFLDGARFVVVPLFFPAALGLAQRSRKL